MVGCPTVHVSALVRSFVVVAVQVGVEVRLHFVQGRIPILASLNPEVLVEQCPVQPLHKAIALRASDTGCPMFDAFQLQEQFVGSLAGRPQNSRPLSESTVMTGVSCSSKKGSTDSLSMCTSVTGSLLVHSLPKA